LVENSPEIVNDVVPASNTPPQTVITTSADPVSPITTNQVTNSVVNNIVNVVVDQQIKKENLILDIVNLDQYSQHFRNQNEIWIESDLS